MRVRNIIAVAALLACLHTVRALPASAQEGAEVSDFSLTAVSDAQQPSVTEKGYFIYQLAPGSTSAGTLLVVNSGDKPLEVQLAVVPAMTAQNGGSTFGSPGSGGGGPAAWVKLDRASVSLEAGASSTVGFVVRVPGAVQPGQYLAGVAAYKPKTEVTKQISNGQNQASAILDVQMRYVVAVQVDVPGAWQAAMSIPEVSVMEQPSGAFLGVHLKNSGDTLLRPTGTVKVADESGNTIVERAINMGTFVTGTEVRYPVPWPAVPKPGSYSVRVVLNYGDGKTTTYDQVMTVEAPENAVPARPATDSQSAQDPQANGSANNLATNAAPAQAVGVVLVAIEPWMLYGFGFVLLAIVVLLALNLAAGRRRQKAE
ncbi:MAG TPA: DUF916 domain-containing protein [Chloroflexia bacterium]|nr:DUF916 domain-containing protein [Chloroflexia bacterium]